MGEENRMSDRLRVDYVAIDQIVNDMKKYEEEIGSRYTDMTAIVESLVNDGYMEAESADAYITEFKEMLGPDLKKLLDIVHKFYTQLSQICQNFADHDSKIADMLFF